MPIQKQTRRKKLSNLLMPRTPMKGALLFIMLFAVIGGGYYVYRSFALSTPPLILSDSDEPTASSQVITSATVDPASTNVTEAVVGNSLVTHDTPPSTSTFATSPGYYSPNHGYVAWTDKVISPDNSISGVVRVRALSGTSKSSSTKSYTLPAGETGDINSSLAWYPDSSKIAFVTAKNVVIGSNGVSNVYYTLRTLNLSSGVIGQLLSPQPGSLYKADIAVMSDGKTIAGAFPDAVKVLSPGATAFTNLPSYPNCSKLKARPKNAMQISYICPGAKTSALYWQTVSTSSQPQLVYNALPQDGEVTDSAWTPAGDRIALYTHKVASSQLGNCNYNTQILSILPDTSGLVPVVSTPFGLYTHCYAWDANLYNNISYSPDGVYLAFVDRNWHESLGTQQQDIVRIAPISGVNNQRSVSRNHIVSIDW